MYCAAPLFNVRYFCREEILQLQNSARTSEESLAIALQAASLAAQSAAMASEGRDRDEGTEAARCPTVVDHNSSQDEQILKDVNKDDLDDTFDSSISGHRGAYDVDTISGGSLEISDSVSLLPFGGKSEVTIRRNISGSTLQATLASKSGTSFEIADGLQLPLNVPDKLLYIGEV